MDYNKSEDAVFKKAMEVFQQSAVSFFNINAKIVAPAETEIKNIEIKTGYMDYLFYTEDGNYLHFEFQTTNKKSDIDRFLYYDASLYYKQKRKIRTIVIYSSEIECVDEYLDAGTIKYAIETFYMKNLNADEQLRYIDEKICKNEALTGKDILTITFLPLMSSSKSRSEMAVKSLEVAQSLSDSVLKSQSISMLYVLLDKFGDKVSKEKLKEMITVTEIGKMIRDEAIEEGMKEGIREGIKKGVEEGKTKGKSELIIKLLIKKFKRLPEGYTEKIKNLSDETLDILAVDILDLDSITDLEKYF